jgi:hypothetical protein
LPLILQKQLDSAREGPKKIRTAPDLPARAKKLSIRVALAIGVGLWRGCGMDKCRSDRYGDRDFYKC